MICQNMIDLQSTSYKNRVNRFQMIFPLYMNFSFNLKYEKMIGKHDFILLIMIARKYALKVFI